MKNQILLCLVLFLVNGCTTVDTNTKCSSFCKSTIVSMPIDSSKASISNGVLYSLPLQDAELVIENKLIVKKDLASKETALKATLDRLKGELKALKFEHKSIKEFVAKIPKSKPKILQEKNNELASTAILITLKKDEITKVKENIELSQSQLKLLPIDTSEAFILSASLKSLKPYAAPNLVLSAVMPDSLSSSETVELKTSSSGLLAGGSGVSKGNVDEIFIAFAGALGAFKGQKLANKSTHPEPKLLLAEYPPERTPSNCVQETFKKSFRITPYKQENKILSKVNSFFNSNNYCFHASVLSNNDFTYSYPSLVGATTKSNDTQPENQGKGKTPSNKGGSNKKTAKKTEYLDGLAYPRKSPFKIKICRSKGVKSPHCIINEDFISQENILTANLISPKRLGVLKLNRGFFADNSHEFEFTDGLLTRFKSDRGNETLSFLAMFPEAAKAIIKIPAELIQIKFDLSDNEKAYYEAQTEILKQKIMYDHYLDNNSAAINN